MAWYKILRVHICAFANEWRYWCWGKYCTKYPKFSARRFIRENGDVSTLSSSTCHHSLKLFSSSTPPYHSSPDICPSTGWTLLASSQARCCNISLQKPGLRSANAHSLLCPYHRAIICNTIAKIFSKHHEIVTIRRTFINVINVWNTCAKLWSINGCFKPSNFKESS